MEYQEITKENIVRVLEFNNIPKDRYEIAALWIRASNEGCTTANHFDFANPNWLQHIELYFGKLQPLPKLGCTIWNDILLAIDDCYMSDNKDYGDGSDNLEELNTAKALVNKLYNEIVLAQQIQFDRFKAHPNDAINTARVEDAYNSLAWVLNIGAHHE